MRWRGGRKSGNVRDLRGRGGYSRGGMGGMAAGGGGLGIIAIILYLIFGGGGGLFGGGGTGVQEQPPTGITQTGDRTEDEMAEFVSVVLAYTEDSWNEIFQEEGLEYREPTLTLFSDQVQSACGVASSQVGPFYCPADEQVYIDLAFFDQLSRDYGASGDFAMAYVIAHEVGHHVQNLLGIMDQVQGYRGRVSDTEYNELNVRLELQADYLAGVWANYVQNEGLLEQGDFEEALQAAFAVGDDTLQMQGQGYVVPDSFTHGTSEQRMRWFRRGFETGDLSNGDTFNTNDL